MEKHWCRLFGFVIFDVTHAVRNLDKFTHVLVCNKDVVGHFLYIVEVTGKHFHDPDKHPFSEVDLDGVVLVVDVCQAQDHCHVELLLAGERCGTFRSEANDTTLLRREVAEHREVCRGLWKRIRRGSRSDR